MNNIKETSISKWLNHSSIEEDGFSIDFMGNNYTNEYYLPEEVNIIMTGVENSINKFNVNLENSTIDFDNNENEDKKINSSLFNSKQLKSTEVAKSLEAVSKYNKPLKTSTFYQSIKQYKGTVQSINKTEDIFTASLSNIDEEDDELIAEFSFKDVSFGSDEELLRLGAIFIWLIGQEIEHGTVKNVTKFIFRRTPVIRRKELQEVKENAKKWAEFFDGIGNTETT